MSLSHIASLVAALLLVAGVARAQDAPPEEVVSEAYPEAGPDAPAEPPIAPEPEGASEPLLTRRAGLSGLLSIAGELGTLPRGQIGSGRKVVGGLSGALLLAPPHWPVLLGLGGGNLWLESSSQRGPDVSIRGDLPFRSTTRIERSLEVRHFEAIARLQPYFGRVRPYLEGVFGLGVLWQGADLEDENGNVIARQERQRKATWISGGTAGVDFALSRNMQGGGLCLGLGVKVLRTGALPRIVFSDAQDSYRVSSSGRAQLTMWLPFLNLSFAY